MLTYHSWRSHPAYGWVVNGENLLPPNAYVDEVDFIKQFARFFPEKGDKVLGRLATCRNKLAIENFVGMATFKIIEYLNKKFPNQPVHQTA